MQWESYLFQDEKTGAFFHYTENAFFDQTHVFSEPSANHILWNQGSTELKFYCDANLIYLPPHSFTTTTSFHFVRLIPNQEPFTCISFNREFYCLRDHDHEISCNGILFYGAQTFAIHNLDPVERESAHQIFQLFKVEFEKKDPVHGEMLVSLLKVLIIILTRIGKKQVRAIDGNSQEIELIRRFNLLVDLNFRQQKQINDYAFELGVSAKKLSSTFKKAKLDPPLTRIHQRIILEAKRLLLFSLKSVTEISDELGFEDMSQFSKLFKKITNESPSQFKTGISERQSQEQQI